jgi:hypothetical protein
VAQVAQLGFLSVPFAVQFGIWISLGLMRFVGPLLAPKLVAPIIAAIFLLKALLARTCLDQLPVSLEVSGASLC